MLIGLYCFGRIKQPELRMLIVWVCVTVINEVVVIEALKANGLSRYRGLDYNIFSFFDAAIWLFIFYKLLNGSLTKLFFGVLLLCIYTAFAVEMFYFKTCYYFHVNSMAIYQVVLLLLSFIFLIKILRLKYFLILSSYSFWLVTACLLFHSISLINFAAIGFYDVLPKYPFHAVQTGANFFYYTCISIGFIEAYNAK